jgi:hypothetical protein
MRYARFSSAPGRPWPLCVIIDEEGHQTGFGAMRGPPSHVRDLSLFADFFRAHNMIGLTSRGCFPGVHPNLTDVFPSGPPGTRSLVDQCAGWAHCFRESEDYLPIGRPAILLAESDFKDPDQVRATGWKGPRRPSARWDVVYVAGQYGVHDLAKGWWLAKECLLRMRAQLGLRVLVVGRVGFDGLHEVDGIDVRGQLPWHELMECVAASSVAFFPQVLDPSPRLLAEALCLDVRVLVNHGIVGGWHYVNSSTGEFFHNETDVVAAAMRCLVADRHPAEWFRMHHGPRLAGARLSRFVHDLTPH